MTKNTSAIRRTRSVKSPTPYGERSRAPSPLEGDSNTRSSLTETRNRACPVGSRSPSPQTDAAPGVKDSNDPPPAPPQNTPLAPVESVPPSETTATTTEQPPTPPIVPPEVIPAEASGSAADAAADAAAAARHARSRYELRCAIDNDGFINEHPSIEFTDLRVTPDLPMIQAMHPAIVMNQMAWVRKRIKDLDQLLARARARPLTLQMAIHEQSSMAWSEDIQRLMASIKEQEARHHQLSQQLERLSAPWMVNYTEAMTNYTAVMRDWLGKQK